MDSEKGTSALLTTREAFRRLGIAERTGRSWIAAGRLPVIRLSSRCLRIDERDLTRFIAARKA